MSPIRCAIAASLALALAGPALAQDAPVATAPAGGAGAPSTAAQIEEYLRASPAAAPPRDEAADLQPERRVRGEVEVGVGTGGYRHVSGRIDAPLGKNGHVSIAAGKTEGRGLVLACPGSGLAVEDPLGRCAPFVEAR